MKLCDRMRFRFGVSGDHMALAQAFPVPSVPSSCYQCGIDQNFNFQKKDHNVSLLALARAASLEIGLSRDSLGSRSGRSDILHRRWSLNAVGTHIVENAPTCASIEIPVNCYQVTFLDLSRSLNHPMFLCS